MRVAALRALVLTALAFLTAPVPLRAEPTFLARQYTRCSTCHYSPTGGGLLTPYGRSLSREELSTTGRRAAPESGGTAGITGEEAFLWGALGDKLGPVQLGLELRPSHLRYSVAGTETSRNLFMNADLIAAFRKNGWTAYGEIGRQPETAVEEAKVDSYEYWVARQPERGIGFRVGRFLPAYGVRFADHTAYNRSLLGFEQYDQIYGVEVSQTADRYLVQLSAGPGRADSIIDDDGGQAFTASGRFQFDINPRAVLVGSAVYRDASDVEEKNGSGGIAFGFAPLAWLSVWNQLDAQFRDDADETAYVFVNETSVEAFRGVWLKVSPQVRSDAGSTSPGLVRWLVGADLLPRTHWNVNISYYHDRNRQSDIVSKIFLIQLHLYI